MAYRVIKTVKGIAYEYEQRSFRVGGQVRTESRYIGPVGGGSGGGAGNGSTNKAESDRAGEPYQEAPEQSDDSGGSAAIPDGAERGAAPGGSGDSVTHQDAKAKANDKGKLPKDPELSLQIRANLESLKISAAAIEAEHRQHLAKLQRCGIDAASVPHITIEHGGAVTHQKRAFRKAYAVTIPKRKTGNRQKLRNEYRKALGRATLDAIEHGQPEAYARLCFAFDASFRASQAALNRYILNTDDPGKWRKAFALKAFGYMNQVESTDPEQIGLIDYGERKDWKGEFSELFATVQGKGFDEIKEATKKELANARRAETAAIKKKTFWIFARRRAIKRAQARIQSHEENLRKLEILRSVGLF